MSDTRDKTANGDTSPAPSEDAAVTVTETTSDQAGTNAGTDERQARTGDDFLVPGPSPQSNEGLGRWGCTWIAFSLLLILLMLAMSFICLTLANWTGIA